MEEKITLKTFGKAAIGIPIGITFLIFCYISIYFVESAEAYKNVAMDITNINIFMWQLVVMSAVGYIIMLFTNITSIVSYKADRDNSSKWSVLGLPLLMGLTYFIPSLIIILSKNLFNYDVYLLVIALGLIFFGGIFIINIMSKAITQDRINKKIKEKNNL